jgi:hypothetical protein
MFNSLKYVKRLEEVGLTREQAAAHTQIMTEVIDSNLATKHDMKDLEAATSQNFKDVRQDTKDLESRLEQKINDLGHQIILSEHRTIIKLGSIIPVAVAVAVVVIKLF